MIIFSKNNQENGKTFSDEENRDVWFVLDDGKRFGGHRVVLMNSDVEWFSTILKSSFKESKEKTIAVKDVESSVFEIALKYAYGITKFSGTFKFNRESVLPIFKAASHFLCKGLIDKLETRCPKSLKIIFVDCGMQFGDEFIRWISGYDFSVKHIIDYFSETYSDEEERNEFIHKTFEISTLKEDDVYNYLDIPGIAERINLKKAEIFLKIINYSYRINANAATFPLLLSKFAKRGLIPYQEIIHLMLYGINSFVIEKFPLKIGLKVPSTGFKIRIPEDRGKILFVFNEYTNTKEEYQPRDLKEDRQIFYIFYSE